MNLFFYDLINQVFCFSKATLSSSTLLNFTFLLFSKTEALEKPFPVPPTAN